MSSFLKAPIAGLALIAAAGAAGAAEVKVGSVAGVTGPIADLVADIVAGRNLAAAEVNAQGGLFASGDTLSMVLGDSACDPKAAVDAGTKVVNVDQVVAIVGPNCSGATSAMVQSVTVPAGVVNVSESATAPAISDLADNDLVFRVAASDSYQGVALAEAVLAEGLTSVAMTYANDDYNAGLAAVFEAAFREKGGTITAAQMHEPNKASYRGEVATLGGSGGSALVIFAYYGSSGITIIRNALETGMFDAFVGADGMTNEEVITQIGAENLAKSFFMTPAADDATDAYARFAAAAGAAGVKPDAPYVAQGYDATFLVALAIEKAGSADRSAISAALREVASAPGEVVLPGEWEKAKALIAAGTDIDYQGASGAVEFDSRGDVAGIYAINRARADGGWDRTILK